MPAKKPSGRTFSAAHVLQLIELVKRWQVTERELLSGLSVRAERLRDPQAVVSVEQFVTLLERARKLTAEPGLGIYLGLHTRISSHGFLGFAAMSASTYIEAVTLMIRYLPIRTTAFSFRSHRDGELGVLTIDEHADFRSVRDVVLLALLIGLRQSAAMLTGREVQMDLSLTIPRPTYFDRFEHALPVTRFDQPYSGISGPITNIDQPLALADPEALELAREQCERLLTSLGLDGRFAPKVRGLLAQSDGQLDSLEDVAHELGLSKRTLRRRLDDEQMPFATLLKEARKEKAMRLLGQRELTVEDVGLRLGYSTHAAFSRAFTGWTGTTPSEFRGRAGAGKTSR